jgi:hypothetical protein
MNQVVRFFQRAEKYLGAHKVKIFIVMPIQGAQSGTQEEQRIYKEYDERFEVIEKVVGKYDGIAIRIDKEHALDDLVARIKREIQDCGFVIADLTDERPSCYFEAGYAEALKRPVIYVASKQSVEKPGTNTKIHFDIHMSINFFVNLKELKERLTKAIEKNKTKLFSAAPERDLTIKSYGHSPRWFGCHLAPGGSSSGTRLFHGALRPQARRMMRSRASVPSAPAPTP